MTHLEPLDPRQLLAFVAAINFQPLNAPKAPGMLVDYGSTYGVRRGGLSYGWDTDQSSNAVDRNLAISGTQRNDTFIAMQTFGTVGAKWEMGLSDAGPYRVTIVAGDPGMPGEKMAFTAEGSVVLSGQTSKSKRWLTGASTVYVTDGRLTITTSNFSTTDKINYIVVERVSPPVPTISIADTATFSTEGGVRGRMRVQRTGGDLSKPLTIPLTVTGTATNAIDYGRVGKAVTFAAGVSTIDLNISAPDDGLVEGNESVTVGIEPVLGYQVGFNSATVTILDANLVLDKNVSWASKASSPLGKRDAFGAAVNGKLYVFGGYTDSSGKPTSSARVFNPANNTWSTIASLNWGQSHVAATAADSYIYFAGGYPGTGPSNTEVLATSRVYRYNTVTDAYIDVQSLPAARGAGALTKLGTKLYFFGGNDLAGVDKSDAYVFDLLNQSAGWSAIASLPAARSHGAAVSLNGFIYYVGGQQTVGGDTTYSNAVWRYNPNTNTWKTVGPLATARSQIAASTFIYDGKIVALGGRAASGAAVSSVEQYDPITNTWQSLHNLPTNRYGGVAALIDTDRFVFTTGYDGSAFRSNTYYGLVS